MDIIAHRRNLHRIPELDKRLPRTMDYLRKVLSGYSCQVFSPIESSLCAYFDFGKDRTLAFRADCDALPIEERTCHDFPSEHPGVMHACGHDGHMAILLELARRLEGKNDLPHNVLLVFQPAEETVGGAKDICETGILEAYNVYCIFGLHLWPGLEKGQVFSRENEMMSRSAEVTVDVYGKSAHIARSWEGQDALPAALEFYRRARDLEGSLPEDVFRLLNFGLFRSGQARNALSDHAHLEGTLRTFQDRYFKALSDGLRSIGREVEESTGCRVALDFSTGYPAILNPPELCRRVIAVAPYKILGTPSMTSEDFSWYQRYIPGMFFFLGLGDSPALHSADFDFDELILALGADYFEALADRFSPEEG